MNVFLRAKKLMQKERVAHVRAIAKIDAALSALGTGGAGRATHTLSAAARKRISDAQKKRWRAVRNKAK